MKNNSHESQPTSEKPPEVLPVTSDVIVFVDALRSLPEYNEGCLAIKKKLEETRTHLKETEHLKESDLEPLTTVVVQRVWEDSDPFKDYFFDFASSVLHLKAKPESINKQVSDSFKNYEAQATASVAVNENSNASDEQKLQAELARNKAHREVAEKIFDYLLEKGFYTSREEDADRADVLGRCIARAWLVDRGDDIWAAARTMDIVRRVNAVAANEPDEALDVLRNELKKYTPGSRWFLDRDSRDIARKAIMDAGIGDEVRPVKMNGFFAGQINERQLLGYLPPLTQDKSDSQINPITGRPFS